jgi:hypothetical protein
MVGAAAGARRRPPNAGAPAAHSSRQGSPRTWPTCRASATSRRASATSRRASATSFRASAALASYPPEPGRVGPFHDGKTPAVGAVYASAGARRHRHGGASRSLLTSLERGLGGTQMIRPLGRRWKAASRGPVPALSRARCTTPSVGSPARSRDRAVRAAVSRSFAGGASAHCTGMIFADMHRLLAKSSDCTVT